MTAVALVALLFLVLVNGLFVAAEFALVRSSRGRLEALAKEGKAGVAEVLAQLEKLDEVLAACQLGITMASIGIGFLGEPALASLIEPLIEGPVGEGVAIGIAFAVAFAISTALHITVGEQVPKMMAITRPEPAARVLARPVNWFRVGTAPLTWALNRASNGMVRLFGVDPSGLEERHTSEDVKGIIRHSARGGTLDPGEAIMLGGVFHLHEQEAREVMTPIPAVVTVNADESVEDALQRCVSSGHTRLVAIENDNPDRVRGVVHNNSLARLYMNTGADASIESAIRDVPIVPETKPLDDLLAELQRQRSSIGVVVDEYGRTVGIVTVEDILEEVVGEIEDETDARSSTVRRLADGDWYVRGHVAIGDLADAGIELPVDSDAYNSVGGYVFSHLGRLPKRGDRIQANGHEIRVESVRENRIVAVRIRPLTSEHPVVAREEAEEA
ncbi:MAG: hemolysin family protein [Actinomycetota bacterium]|nr:hemolysin family protein [Actinomycetota bacterium]